MRDDCCTDNTIWITTVNDTTDSWLYQKAGEYLTKYFTKDRSEPEESKEEKKEMFTNMNILSEAHLKKNIENLEKIRGSIMLEGSPDDFGITTIEIPTSMLDCIDIHDPDSLKTKSMAWCKYVTPNPTRRIDLSKSSIPKVSRVETYNNRVVKVTFADGSFTKSVCSDKDIFDLDTGITICIMKRILGKDSKTGTRKYNCLIREVHGTMEQNEKEKEKLAREKAERKAKQKKLEQKRIAGREAARQEYIDDIAAGVQRALMARMDDGK